MTLTSRKSNLSAALLATTMAVLGALGCVSPPPPTEAIEATVIAPGADEALRIDQTVILIDASGSMQPASRFPSTQNLASSFVAGMPEGQYLAAVINFGGDASEILAFAPFERYDVDSAVVDGELLGKSTDFPAVLGEVQSLLEGRTGTTAIVVFSDGIATRYGRNLGHASTLARAKQLVAGYRGELCFYTIQSGNDAAGQQLMAGLAGVTSCGQYRNADSLSDAESLHELQRAVFIENSQPAVSARVPDPIFIDADQDGVEDAVDQCLDTPRMAHVNEFGCWVLESYTFEQKQWEILESQYATLDEVAEVLELNPELRIRIDGHTDSVGTEEFNQILSERRANAVLRYLESIGIDPARLETRGFGMSSPVASNDTPEGMASNRRCQMTVLK